MTLANDNTNIIITNTLENVNLYLFFFLLISTPQYNYTK